MKHRVNDRILTQGIEDPAEIRAQKHRTLTLPLSALRVLPSMGLAAAPVTSAPVPIEKSSQETAITVGVGLAALVAGIGLAYVVTRPAHAQNPIRSDDLRAWVEVLQDAATRRIEEHNPFPSLHPPRAGAPTKYWIAPLREEAMRQGMSRASFEEYLWEAHRAGFLRLGRADLTSVFPRTLVQQSEIVHSVGGRPAAVFHFVEFR